MNTTSRRDASHAPQRRNRGTSSKTPANVSEIPSKNADGNVRFSGTLNWCSITAQRGRSVIFQIPETRNKSAVNTAATQFSAVFQAGRSNSESALLGNAISLIYFYSIAGRTRG